MTQISTIVSAISDLSVSGLTICDVDEIPAAVDIRTPTMFPLARFVTDLSVARDSFGADMAKMTISYSLNYRVCYAPVGSNRGGLEHVGGMIVLFGSLLDALLGVVNFSGSVDFELPGAVNFGIVTDPAGNSFWGFDLAIRVSEFIN